MKSNFVIERKKFHEAYFERGESSLSFSPFFLYSFSNNHLEETIFFSFASEANCSYY